MATRGIEAGENTRALARQYSEVRAATLRLAAPLSAEDQMLQSMPEASPAKWHLAHTTWFFETFLLTPHARKYRPFDDPQGFAVHPPQHAGSRRTSCVAS